MMANNKLGNMCMEAVVAYLKKLFQNLPGGTEKLNEKLIEDSNENNSFQRRFTS
jgi:hypothetical protein